MKAGVGYSTENFSFAAGARAAEDALLDGDGLLPDLVLAFCGGGHGATDFFCGVRSVMGTDIPIVGGSVIGIITGEHLSYTGHEAGVAALGLEGVPCEIASGDLGSDVRGAAERLAASFSGAFDPEALIVFYDSLKMPATDFSPPGMNPSPLLIEGLERGLKTAPPVWGAGLLSDFDFYATPSQFCGSSVATQAVVGLLLGPGLKLYSRIMHGCTPLDGVYHRITRSEGAVVYEIDDTPVVELIDALYGHRDWRQKHPVDLLTIGVNHGDKYGLFDEANYVNRLITGALPDDSGVGLFEPDLLPGTEIQFMLRDGARMIESAADNCAALMDRIQRDNRTPRFGLYIDCAGRTAAQSNTPTEEAAEIQQVMTRLGVPLLGFYSGVEIAPCLRRSRGLDWTGVLIIFAE